jgi:outer membrane cobalamin receptor
MNDLLYGAFPLANHLLVDQLERVEIIRGPGSVVYGGHAELAVVNVLTRAASIPGAAGATLTYARGERATSAATVTAAAGAVVGEARFGVSASGGLGARGEATYSDLAGGAYDMSGAADAHPAHVNVFAAWRGGTFRFLYDDYRTTMRDGYDAVTPEPLDVRWRTLGADLRWELRRGERFSVVPQLAYRREIPWQMKDPAYDTFYYDNTADRVTGRVVATWNPTERLSVLGGAEAWFERAWLNDPASEFTFDGATRVSYHNTAAFLEVAADTPVANLLLGARQEWHEIAGGAFVPRFAATKLLAPFHVKLLASGAFRAPSIENVNYGLDPGIRPERTWVLEAEVGWQVASWLFASANAFDARIERPIVFGYDEVADADFYENGPRTGTRGVEAEVRLQHRFGSASASWSYYTASGRNEVAAYAVPGEPDLLLGFAGHKIVAAAQLRLFRDLLLSPAVIVLSERFAFDRTDEAGDPAVGRIGTKATVDLFATWRDAGLRGVEIGLGVRDLLDVGDLYPQPYDGGHAPLPGAGREVMLRLRYER